MVFLFLVDAVSSEDLVDLTFLHIYEWWWYSFTHFPFDLDDVLNHTYVVESLLVKILSCATLTEVSPSVFY